MNKGYTIPQHSIHCEIEITNVKKVFCEENNTSLTILHPIREICQATENFTPLALLTEISGEHRPIFGLNHL